MKFSCIQCGQCCRELNTFIDFHDIDKWLNEGRLEILSSLAWHFIAGRNPPYMLMMPKKSHIRFHSFLSYLDKPEYAKDNSCIFLLNGKCSIYEVRPFSCELFPKGKVDYPCPGIKEKDIKDRTGENIMAHKRKLDNTKLYENREIVSKMMITARKTADKNKLKILIEGEKQEA